MSDFQINKFIDVGIAIQNGFEIVDVPTLDNLSIMKVYIFCLTHIEMFNKMEQEQTMPSQKPFYKCKWSNGEEFALNEGNYLRIANTAKIMYPYLIIAKKYLSELPNEEYMKLMHKAINDNEMQKK